LHLIQNCVDTLFFLILGRVLHGDYSASWQEAEVLGRKIAKVTPAETSKEQVMNIMNRLIEGEHWSGEFVAKRRDGTIFLAIVTNSTITNDKGEIIGIIGGVNRHNRAKVDARSFRRCNRKSGRA